MLQKSRQSRTVGPGHITRTRSKEVHEEGSTRCKSMFYIAPRILEVSRSLLYTAFYYVQS